ncbi:MAG TPA: glycosyltransferase [Candidatus Woesebacteria bacterium]|jgi:glycosyltransferase involved in cell wall biosynthesis|nr:glycosyltransferase [Candidatus Woesebacteria bacterium]
MSSPKIALVQDYIKEFGGAESVLETLSDIFPKAPIFTSIYHPASLGPHQSRLRQKWDHRIHQSFFKFIPFAHKIISPLRLISPLAFKSFDFSDFDIIITSATGAYFPNSLNKKSAKLICYCHTPPRYLYGLPTARRFTQNPIVKFFINILNHFLRLRDFHHSQNVDQYIANSRTTAARIQKFYRRQAIVINPPVDLPKSQNTKYLIPNTKYFLAGGRLAQAKRFDIAINACNQLNLKLKIFGRDFSGVLNQLKQISGPTIEFVGEVDQETKSQLYRNAQAFIFSADQEDFGIVPVESMSYGCPVIAYRSGGVTETVIDGKTGVFFDQLTPQSCAQAIQKFQKLNINPSDCISRAAKFSTQTFIQKIKKLVSKNQLTFKNSKNSNC